MGSRLINFLMSPKYVPDRESYRTQMPKFFTNPGVFSATFFTEMISPAVLLTFVVRNKVPESRFGGNWIRREESDSVHRWVWVRVRRQLSASNDELAKIAFCLHF